MLKPGQIENRVLMGEDGQLFLAGGSHNVFEIVTGAASVPEQSFKTFNGNIAVRAKWAARKNIPFLHIIFPDKQSVLKDHWPYEKLIMLGKLYIDRAGQQGNSLYYPVDILRKVGDAAYLKTDTHLSDIGSLSVAADLIYELTGKKFSDVEKTLLDAPSEMVEHSGDLGSKLSIKATAKERSLSIKRPGPVFSNGITNGNNGLIDLRFNRHAPLAKRLVMFGDSFGRDLCVHLHFWFREVFFFRTPFFHDDIAGQLDPDFLVTENVERYLDLVLPDEDRPFFFAYPHLKGDGYEPTASFATALSAVMSGKRGPYRAFLASLEQQAPEKPEPGLRATSKPQLLLKDWIPSGGESKVVEPASARVRPKPAFILNLSGHDIPDWHHDTQELHGSNFVHRTGVFLFGPNHLVSANGHWSCESRAFKRQFLNVTSGRPFQATFSGPPVTITYDDTRAFLDGDDLNMDGAIRLNNPVFLATPLEPDNWGRWVATVFPKVQLHKTLCPERMFLCHCDKPWQEAFLAAAGLDMDKLTKHQPGRLYFCDDVATIDYSITNMSVSRNERAMFTSFVQSSGQVHRRRKLFISRLSHSRKHSGYRVLQNEADLIDALKGLGIEPYEPEFDPPKAQWTAFGQADRVVALGGAALYNCSFCPPGARIVTIESGTSFIRPHTELLCSLDMEFGIVFGQQDTTDTAPVHRRWTVDVDLTAKMIGEFFDENGRSD